MPPFNVNSKTITACKDEANVLNNLFHAVFTKGDLAHQPICGYSPNVSMSDIAISSDSAKVTHYTRYLKSYWP